MEKAIDVYRKGGNFPNMLRIMSRLGIYYHLSGEYEKAIATNQEAIATYNDSIAPGNVVIAYGEQANLYAELGMYDQALEMNKKSPILLHAERQLRTGRLVPLPCPDLS